MKPRLLIAITVAVLVAGVLGYVWGSRTARDAGTTANLTQAAAPETGPTSGRSILYYRNAMGLPDTSPVPKKDPMGMDYVPVYEGEESAAALVRISSSKLQKLGVRTEPVIHRPLTQTLRIVGNLQVDEGRQYTLSTKFEGWIARLFVDTTGARVHRGEALLEVYSPDLLSAQQDYRVAVHALKALHDGDSESRAGMQALVQSSLERLRNWDIAESDLASLRNGESAPHNLVLRAQHDGVVIEKVARAGMRFMPGDPLYQIADLSTVWLIGSVFEQDIALVHVGQPVTASMAAYPSRTFTGTVTFVSPVLQAETRTAQVRIELSNPERLLKPAMYGTVDLVAGASDQRLAVPDSAILDTGTRQLVLLDRGGGVFEPREVRLGIHGDGYTEVLEGVSERDVVVVNGNFLIDAESNLKAAIGGLASHAHGAKPAAGAATSGAPAPEAGSPPAHDHPGR